MAGLRTRGYNVRSVYEIFGRGGIPDDTLTSIAESIGGKVLTKNIKDFPAAVRIGVDGRVNGSLNSILKFLEMGLGNGK